MRSYQLSVGGGLIDVAIADVPFALPDEAIIRWIQRCAEAVSGYFGRFPLRHLLVTVSAGRGRGASGGMAMGDHIQIRLARRIRQSELDNDWVMTHEMLHLGFPSMSDEYAWLREGLATYLEPIARARAGTIPPEQVWGDLVEGLPQGQPHPGDQGLNRTGTWGRTYWGGAMFCMLADIQIRQRTDNRRSLDDAMRAILRQGGNNQAAWSIQRVIDVGDRATGTTVLRDLHTEMGVRSARVDLAFLWSQLGVKETNGKVIFDDSAPLAGIRRSITARAEIAK